MKVKKTLLIEFYDLVKENKADFITADKFKQLFGKNPSTLDDFIELHKDELE